jgi:2,5-diketo-D-gluconate reductase A
MPETTQIPTITLNDGRAIPQLGFGVFQVPPPDTAEATALALDVGYRHIDTAEMYANEQGVGDAVRDSSLDRDAIWITSKLGNPKSEPGEIRAAFEETLQKLGSDQVDLFLIHWPLPTRPGSDFVTRWKVLEEFKADGRARSIGVSNFEVAHLERLAAECDVVPAVNQIELHPYFLNEEVRGYGESHGIATEAWSPIAQGGVLGDPVITEIAERVERTAAQVVLRWHIQRSSIVFPKSVTPARVRENFELFDFELTDADMEAITGLDKGEAGRTGPNPNRFTGGD